MIDPYMPPVSADEIHAFEIRNNLSLPSGYISFLLNHNGGVPSPSVFISSNGKCVNLALLFAITGKEIEEELQFVQDEVGVGWFPIGISGGGDYFLISLDTGAVYYFEHELKLDEEEDNLYFLEPSMDAMLNKINGT